MIAIICGLAVVVAVLLLPVGVRASYDSGGAILQLLVGPICVQLFPVMKKTRKRKPEKRSRKGNTTAVKTKTKTGGNLSDFLPIFRVAWDLLRDFSNKLTVERLEVKLVLAGEDPCDLSLNYGRTWAAVSNLMPRLESVVTIHKRDINISCDYMADQSTVFLLADITMSIAKLVALAARYGWRGFIEYRKLLKIRKGGA